VTKLKTLTSDKALNSLIGYMDHLSVSSYTRVTNSEKWSIFLWPTQNLHVFQIRNTKYIPVFKILVFHIRASSELRLVSVNHFKPDQRYQICHKSAAQPNKCSLLSCRSPSI